MKNFTQLGVFLGVCACTAAVHTKQVVAGNEQQANAPTFLVVCKTPEAVKNYGTKPVKDHGLKVFDDNGEVLCAVPHLTWVAESIVEEIKGENTTSCLVEIKTPGSNSKFFTIIPIYKSTTCDKAIPTHQKALLMQSI